MNGLDELAERVRFELDCVGYPAREWVKPRFHDGERVLDVLIVGGGQNGISLAFRLLRERVTNIRVLDPQPGRLVGPLGHLCPHAHAEDAEACLGSGDGNPEPFGARLVRGEIRRRGLGAE